VPTSKDTAAGCEQLRKGAARAGLGFVTVKPETPADEYAPIQCIGLLAKVNDELRARATEPARDGVRHVVFATNVAESSLTVEGLSFVVDTGMVFRARYDLFTDTVLSGKELVTAAEARQRMGRVGRRAPGTAVHLYTARQLAHDMAAHPAPAIAAGDVTDELFKMLLAAPRGAAWEAAAAAPARALPTPVTKAQLAAAEDAVRFYGCLDARGALTEVGHALKRISEAGARVSFDSLLLLLAGWVFGVPDSAAALAAMLKDTAGEVSSLWRR
jgi:pre-mRNA-splicing factor ATP-dependent RNA helicase DHX15/PRP43